MDVDAQDEQFADLHVDFAAGEVDAACAGDGGGDGLGGCYCCVEEVFVEGSLLPSLVSKRSEVIWAGRVSLRRTGSPSYSAPKHD